MASQRPKPRGSDIKQPRKLTMADGLLTAKSGRCRTRLLRCSAHRKPTRASALWLTLDLLADTTVVGREHSQRIIRNSAGCEKLQLKSTTYPKILQKIGRYHLVMYLLVAPLELVIMQLLRGEKYNISTVLPRFCSVCLSPFSSSPLSSPSPPRLHLHLVGFAQTVCSELWRVKQRPQW